MQLPEPGADIDIVTALHFDASSPTPFVTAKQSGRSSPTIGDGFNSLLRRVSGSSPRAADVVRSTSSPSSRMCVNDNVSDASPCRAGYDSRLSSPREHRRQDDAS